MTPKTHDPSMTGARSIDASLFSSIEAQLAAEASAKGVDPTDRESATLEQEVTLLPPATPGQAPESGPPSLESFLTSLRAFEIRPGSTYVIFCPESHFAKLGSLLSEIQSLNWSGIILPATFSPDGEVLVKIGALKEVEALATSIREAGGVV